MKTRKTTLNNPFWVKATIQDSEPFFAQLHRLCSKATIKQLREMTRLLNAGEDVFLSDVDMWVQNTGLSAREKKQKALLENFEIDGYKLDSFRMNDSGVYCKGDQYCYSMSAQVACGFLPSPLIALDARNTRIVDAKGGLVDVFVAVALGAQFFSHPVLAMPIVNAEDPVYAPI